MRRFVPDRAQYLRMLKPSVGPDVLFWTSPDADENADITILTSADADVKYDICAFAGI